MSLTTCLKKAGAYLHPDDKAAILAAAREHRSTGLSNDDAGRKAITDRLAVVSHPDFLKSLNTTPAPEGIADKPGPAKPEAAPEEPIKEIKQPDTRKASALARRSMGLNVDDSLLTALAKFGGVNRDSAREHLGVSKDSFGFTVKSGNLTGYPFRKQGGMSADRALETLVEAGYLYDIPADDQMRGFEDAVSDELGGSAHFTAEGHTHRAQEMDRTERQAQDEADEASKEPPALDEIEARELDDALRATVLTKADLAAMTNDDVDDLMREPKASIMRALGFDDEEIAHAEQTDAQRSAAKGAESADSTAQTSGEPRSGTPGPEPALALEGQDAEGLKAKTERESAATAADKAEQKRLTDKASADAQRGEFTLTGSDRAADVAAAAGQGDIFAAPAEQPAKVAQTAPAGKAIEDFGEKIAGARKDYAATLKEAQSLDVAAEPLSKSWPEPSYDKLLENGIAPYAAAFVRAARDQVPTKPQSSWKLGRWVEQVKLLRDISARILSGNIKPEAVQGALADKAFSSLRDALSSAIDLYQLVGHEKSLKGVSITSGQYSMYDGVTYSPAKVIWSVEQKAKGGIFGNWPRQIATGETREQALNAFVEKYKGLELAPQSKQGTQFVIWRGDGKYVVGKKIGKEYAGFKKFDSVKEAREWKAANQAELETMLARYKDTPFERNTENAPRVGEDHRGGARVTPEVFAATLGFRGVQFGNYVEDSRRQQDLNDAYDALMDLAAVIGVPPRALSLDGKLGLAFGARGTGGKDAAAAHYEPGHVVINLTKNAGAGSLAHEWLHATDNYFAKMNSGPGGFMTSGAKNDAVRPAMLDAFAKVRAAIRASAMSQRSRALDRRKSKPYWSTGEELAARAFESYIIAKLQDQSARNDYLANVVSEKFWDAQEALLGHENEKTYPYPTTAEMGPIREAFDHFFNVLETRTDAAGNVALASRGTAAVGMDPDALRKQVATITRNWKNGPAGGVNVVGSDAIPSALRSADQGGDVRGWFDPATKTVNLVADRLGSPGEAQFVLFHESYGHLGMRAFLGADYASTMMQMRRANPGVSTQAALWTARHGTTQIAADMANGMSRQEAEVNLRLVSAEEALSDRAGAAPTASSMKFLLARLQRGLRAIGLDKVADWLENHTDAEVLDLLANARNEVQNGGQAVAAPESGRAGSAVAFSRTPGSLAGTLNDVADIRLPAGYIVNDFMRSTPGKISFWDKTVGTMFNVAEKNPTTFKPVFDELQNFINDTGKYANEHANLAPSLIPQLNRFGDMLKQPISAADTGAIAAPVFEGTLIWTRDADGKPVKLEDAKSAAEGTATAQKADRLLRDGGVTEAELRRWQATPFSRIYEGAIENRFAERYMHAGTVFSDAELRDLFKLNDRQIGLYHEFRKATDGSLADLAKSEMLRLAGQDASPSVRAALMHTKSATEAATLLRGELHSAAETSPSRAKVLNGVAERIAEVAERTTNLQQRGYAPLSRFGPLTLDVLSKEGDRLYFGLFETDHERSRMARMLKNANPEATVTQGTVSQEEYRLMAGVDPDTIALFGDILGLDQTGDKASDVVFQEWIKKAVSTRSTLQWLVHRKGIAGFSEDAARVLAGFITSNARRLSSNLHMNAIDEHTLAIPQGQGELKDLAVKLGQYVKQPQEEAHQLRSLLFAQYLGGSVASAMVNATQPFLVSIPYLSQFGGIAKAGAQMLRASKDAVSFAKTKTTGDAGLDAAMKEHVNVISTQEIHQMQAQARGSAVLISGDGTKAGDAYATATNALSRLQFAWGKVFSVAEQFNRRSTFIAAYRMAVERGEADPGAFAADAVNQTQFVYSKANRPQWARGAVGSTLFTFKSFTISYLELLGRMWNAGAAGSLERAAGRKATLLALGVLMLASGADGLPFEDNVDDVVDGFMQRVMGRNFSLKRLRHGLLQQAFGDDLGHAMEKGLTGIPGVPIDVSGRLGMNRVIPGTGLLVKKQDYTKDLTDILGPVGDLATRGLQATASVAQGDFGAAAKVVQAQAVRNFITGWDALMTGTYHDDKGRVVVPVSALEAAAKMIGFQPQTVARIQEASGQVMQEVELTKIVKGELQAKYAQALVGNDEEGMAAVRAAIVAWNKANPEAPMALNRPAIAKLARELRESKAERLAHTAPAAMRQRVREQLAGAVQ